MKKILPIILALIIAAVLAHAIKGRMTENALIERHNRLVASANECLGSGHWKCAEDAVSELLKETPDDYNLNVHMAGILLEQERYEDCLDWIFKVQQKALKSSTSEVLDELATIEKKAKSLMKEMAELNIESSTHFRLEFEGNPARTDVIEALTVLEIAYDSLQRLFEFYPENKMPIVLYESKEYQGIGPRPDWVAASFDGKLRIPVNLMQHREWYRPILFHELTHSFIRAIARNSVPLWLNEGIAQVIDASKSGKERPEGGKPDLQELTTPFVNQKNGKRVELLYWYSEKMVQKLLQINGNFTILKNALAEISKTGDTDSALVKFYGTNAKKLLDSTP